MEQNAPFEIFPGPHHVCDLGWKYHHESIYWATRSANANGESDCNSYGVHAEKEPPPIDPGIFCLLGKGGASGGHARAARIAKEELSDSARKRGSGWLG